MASLQARAEALLKEMSLEEKSAQLCCHFGTRFLDSKTRGYVGDDAAEEFLKNGLGQITRLGGSTQLDPEEIAQLYNRIQKYLVEKTRLGIPVINREESLAGLMTNSSSVYPHTINEGCTWHPELIQEMADQIRRQMRAVGATHTMSPNIDISREPRWGRVEETFGEDPYLTSQMGLAYVRGIQGRDLTGGVAACGKHFVGHGLPERGMNQAPVRLGRRELEEVFARPFLTCFELGHMKSVMAAYHESDGVPVHASREILTKLLRERLGFKGIVISDANGISMIQQRHFASENEMQTARLALEAGVAVELPHREYYGSPLVEGVTKGIIPEEVVDSHVLGVIMLKLELGLFDNPYVEPEAAGNVYARPEMKQTSKQIAEESIVLLKNAGGILPIDPEKITKLALVGPNADSWRCLYGDYHFPAHIDGIETFLSDDKETMGTLYSSGLARVDASCRQHSLRKSLEQKFPDAEISFARGCEHISRDRSGLEEVVETARDSDAAIMALGGISGMKLAATSGESRDRTSIELPGLQIELFRRIHELQIPVIVVLFNGRPYALQEISEKASAVIEAWLPGQYGPDAVADIICGNVNPSGKLTVTLPRATGQVPVYYNHKPTAGYSQWHRDYVETSAEPLYPFGHGLSYSSFRWSNLKIDAGNRTTSSELKIRCTIENVSSNHGAEIVQLYVRDLVGSVTRPVKELKAFRKIHLAKAEKKTVEFTLPPGSLSFLDLNYTYRTEPGEFHVMLGSSSDDIRLEKTLTLKGKIEYFEKIPLQAEVRIEPPPKLT